MTNTKRILAGRVIALLYLFCVFAPGAMLALGGAAPWLAKDLKLAVAAHAHDHSSHQHGDAQDAHEPGAGNTGHQHDGTASAGPCCAMLCLSAIAADLPAIVKPTQPKSVRVAENYRRLPDNTPARLYRPPIA